MGSPLAPALANIFMGFYESKWLNECNLNKTKFYLRYVDDILVDFKNKQDSLNFFKLLNNRHPNVKFTIEKQINNSIVFFDVLISGINNQNLTLQTYHKSTYMDLLSNFKSFTSFSYKISLIKCLIDRSFKICNNWNSFHNDIENIKSNLIKNAYPPFLIDKVIKKYLDYKFSSNQNQLKDKSDIHYFKLPYISNLSHHIKNKLLKLCKEFCKENFNIFNSSKSKIFFNIKTHLLMIQNLSYNINLLVLAVVLAILAKLVIILKLELMNISKRITSLIFLNIYTSPQHALTNIILFVLT